MISTFDGLSGTSASNIVYTVPTKNDNDAVQTTGDEESILNCIPPNVPSSIKSWVVPLCTIILNLSLTEVGTNSSLHFLNCAAAVSYTHLRAHET